MGMYTELIFGASLKTDTPKEVLDIIEYMLNRDDAAIEPKLPDHKFFKTSRWSWMFHSSSYYFGITRSSSAFYHDVISNCSELSIRCNLKNYGSEIGEFLDWIKPYIDSGSGEKDFYAIVCYEEQEEPTIYYLNKYYGQK